MGLPPTTLKGVNDTTGKTTFQTVFTNLKVNHSGPVGTIGPIYQAGSPNYLASNNDAELDTAGWATYADAAQATPVDGTGGVANITWTRSTSSPLRNTASFLFTKDAVNRQGQGASFDFSIDSSDQAKVLQITFDYKIASGTYADSDLTVYIYDVTNATVIQPAGYTILNASVAMKQIATFQTASNSTSYRLIIHTASTSASAYTVQFDNFVLGPQSVTNGAAVTDWQSYTPTGSWSTNTTYTGLWRRVGDSAEIQFKIALAGAPTSAALTVNLPSGMTIDTAKLSSSANPTVLGHASISDTGVQYYESYVGYSSTTAVALYVMTRSITYVEESTAVTQAVPMTFGNTDYIYGTYKVPIVGWSSNVQLSSDTDTRVVAMQASSTSTQTITSAGGDQQVTGWTASSDTHGGFASNAYAVSVPGYYRVTATTLWGTQASSARGYSAIYVDGANVYTGQQIPLSASFNVSTMASHTFLLRSGQTIKIYNNVTVNTALAATHYWAVERLSGPSVIASSESVNAAYAAAGGQSISTGSVTKVDFATKEFDSHSAFSGNNTYTIPVSGKYLINGIVTINSGTTTTGTRAIYVYKNGSAVRTLSFATNYLTGTNYTTSVSALLSLLAGDTIDIRYLQNITAAETTTSNSFFQIHRTGN